MNAIQIDRRRFLWRAHVALWMCVVVLAVAYGLLRLRSIELVHLQCKTILVEHQDAIATVDAHLKDVHLRLDQIEESLFGEVMSKIMKPPATTAKPSRVEPWQVNRDKSFQDYIRRSHLQLLELDARVRKIEQAIR